MLLLLRNRERERPFVVGRLRDEKEKKEGERRFFSGRFTMSVDQSSEQRTPFRDVQPHELVTDAGGDATELLMVPHAKKHASPLGRKLSGASGAGFDAEAVENFSADHLAAAPFAAADDAASEAAMPSRSPGGSSRVPRNHRAIA